MDSLELIQTFREVAQRGSFSAAARALDMSPANVSKYVAALEARFGVRLFNRTTRKVSLTDAGHLLLQRSGPVLELVQITTGELHDRANTPSGRLALTLPHPLLQTQLPTLLARFLVRHPAVSLDLRATDRVIDLAEEGVDIALRVGPVPNANLIVRRLMPIDRVLVATPAYWAEHGEPKHPRDLAAHKTLAVVQSGEVPKWIFIENGKRFEIPLDPHVESTSLAPMVTLAMHDLGVIYIARLSVSEQLEKGTLKPVLDRFIPQDIWLYAAYAQRRNNSAALTALLAYLEEEFPRQDPKLTLLSGKDC
ncbi:LysR family transcriptional regulator [Ottowia thiooxydans]|uniref:LysR family transcriptional regulator n=1 Tax=Ottowia thiooxydans TaxID=219182 RepID=UPI0003FE0244|nr:LysR family transcriptional regulator [Ottowia thiooxydans]